MVVVVHRGVRGHPRCVPRVDRVVTVMLATDWATPAAIIVAVAIAMFVVPLMARRIERDAYRLPPPPERFGWFHEHVDRERKEPTRMRPHPREGESEGDTWNNNR